MIGYGVECVTYSVQASAGAPQAEHIKLLDGGILPKLRGTMTSCDIHLPCASHFFITWNVFGGFDSFHGQVQPGSTHAQIACGRRHCVRAHLLRHHQPRSIVPPPLSHVVTSRVFRLRSLQFDVPRHLVHLALSSPAV